jgi:AmiR/NasT family two-component response regulator
MSEGLDLGDGDAPASDGSPASTLTPAEMTRLISYADEQERKVSDLQNTVSQLQHALESRVVIDRAVGILSERFDLEIADAFELLRAAARDSRREVRALATQLAEFRHRTPDEIAKAARARRIVDQP